MSRNEPPFRNDEVLMALQRRTMTMIATPTFRGKLSHDFKLLRCSTSRAQSLTARHCHRLRRHASAAQAGSSASTKASASASLRAGAEYTSQCTTDCDGNWMNELNSNIQTIASCKMQMDLLLVSYVLALHCLAFFLTDFLHVLIRRLFSCLMLVM